MRDRSPLVVVAPPSPPNSDRKKAKQKSKTKNQKSKNRREFRDLVGRKYVLLLGDFFLNFLEGMKTWSIFQGDGVIRASCEFSEITDD